MDSIFAKLVLFLASILGLVINPAYIGLDAASLTFNYKTGQDPQIIYYLSVKNIGSQKARFVISSNVSWLSLAREGTGFEKSVDLEIQTAVNFVLTIQTRDIADGSHNAEMTVNAESADIFSNLYDSKKITVTVNKNVAPAPPAGVVTTTPPVSTASPTSTPSVVGTPVVASPTVSALVTPKPKATPTPSRPSVTATPTSVPTVSQTGTPAITPRVPSPFPTIKPLPEEAAPQAQVRRGVLENIWSFFRGLFF